MAKRTIKIDLRLNESEAALLNRKVERSGLSREAYLRALVMNKPIKENPPIEFHEVLKILRKIQVDLERLAITARDTGQINTSRYWENMDALSEAVGKMIRGMYS